MSYFNAGITIPKTENIALNGSTSGTVTLAAPASVTNYTFTLPSTAGTVDQFLKTDGSGNLSYGTPTVGSINSNAVNPSNGDISFTSNDATANIAAATGSNIFLKVGVSDVVDVTTSRVLVSGEVQAGDVSAYGSGAIGPTFNLGLSESNALVIQSTKNLDNTLDKITFTTKTSNATANAGLIEFSIDEATAQLTINDAGISVTGTANISSTANVDSTLEVTGVTTVHNATDSTTATNGALVVTGGVGVAKDITAGNDVHLLSDAAVLNFGADKDVSLTHVADTGLLLNGASAFQFRDSALSINSSTDGQLDIDADVTLQITAPTVDINASTEVNVSGALTVGGAVNIDDTTTSTSTTTGALIVDGGLGVAENLNVGGNMIVTGDLTVNGTTTTINSNVVTIEDPVIELGGAIASETYDRGIKYNYHDGSAKAGFFGLDRSESVFTFYSDATFTAANVVASGTIGNAKFTNLTLDGTLGVTGNVDVYEAVNDANPAIEIGSSTTEALVIQSVFDTGAQTLDKVTFTTKAASATADKGKFEFSVDEATAQLVIDDAGIEVNGTANVSGALYAEAALEVATTTDLAGRLNVEGALTANAAVTTNSTLTTNADVTNNANVTIEKLFTLGVDSITSVVAATEIITSTLYSSIKSFKLNNATDSTYHCNLGFASGQMLHLFYDNVSAAGTANIDFGASNLYVGSGTARYLKFTQTGQSATLVYIDGTDANNAGWRIINTGGTIY